MFIETHTNSRRDRQDNKWPKKKRGKIGLKVIVNI